MGPKIEAACEFVDATGGPRRSARWRTSSASSPATPARGLSLMTADAGADQDGNGRAEIVATATSGTGAVAGPGWACGPDALVVGNVIGSSIFLLPSLLAPFGGLAIVSWLITSAGALVAGAGVRAPRRAGSQGRRTVRLHAPGIRRLRRISDRLGLLDWSVGQRRRRRRRHDELRRRTVPAIASSMPLSGVVAIGMVWLLTSSTCAASRARVDSRR